METDLASFYQRTTAARKILVVDLGFMGDSIHLAPALWEIKRHYPRATLQVLSTPLGAEVLTMLPCVDGVRIFPLSPNSPPWWRHWDILQALRRERFDLAINFSGADRTIFITALSGARWKLAHQGARHHFWNSWLIGNWVSRRNRALPVFEQRRQVLAACGFKLAPAKFDLQVPAAAKEWAVPVVVKGTIHFSVNASTHLKEWPLENWTHLANLLFQEIPALRLVASGSAKAREQERLQKLKAAVQHPNFQLLPPDLTLDQLAAALGRCSLHVGGDSGVLHLAMALGIPTLAIFREYSGLAEWTPVGERHLHVSAPCPCADQKQPGCQNLDYAQCLAAIAPEQLMPLIRKLLNSQ
jgi:ADP-heptose:LPS heptosyltransferase